LSNHNTENKKSQAEIAETIKNAGFVTVDEFAELQPFEKDAELPPFPINALPQTIQSFVNELSEFTQTPPEMSGTLVLSVLAACVQGRYTVRVRDGWFEPLCVYSLIIAAPAERKSAVFKELLSPVYDFQREYNINHAVAVKMPVTA
jgi:hypothetical protein